MARPGTFTSYGKASVCMDPALAAFVGIHALQHEAVLASEQASAEAERLFNAMVCAIEQGPPVPDNIDTYLRSLANSNLDDEDPADKMIAAFDLQCKRAAEKLAASLRPWGAELLSGCYLPDGALRLAGAQAISKLADHLASKTTTLDELLEHGTYSVRADRDQIRENCQRIAQSQRASQTQTSTGDASSRWKSTAWRYSLAWAAGLVLCFGLSVVLQAAFLPYFALASLAPAVLVHFWPVHDSPPQETRGPIRSPFVSQVPRFRQHAELLASVEHHRRELAIVQAVNSLINLQAVEELLGGFEQFQSLLSAQKAAIGDGMFVGESPDLALLTGKLLAGKLWEMRKPGWSSKAYFQNLAVQGGAPTIEQLLEKNAPLVAVDMAIIAATVTLGTLNLTTAIEAVLAIGPEGERCLLNEVDDQVKLLLALLQIGPHAAAFPCDATQTLVHVVVPSRLKNSMALLMNRAFPRLTLNFVEGAGDELSVIVESFGWLNLERKAFEYHRDCLAQRASLAQEQQWSSFNVLECKAPRSLI